MPRPELTPSEIIAILVDTPDELATLTTALTKEQLRAEPGHGEWSVSYILAHLRAAEVVIDQIREIAATFSS